MNTERSPRELIALLMRNKLHVAAITTGALLVASAFALVRPSTYEAHTSLRIQGTAGLDGRDFVDKVHGVTRDIKNQANMSDVVSGLNLDAHLQGLPEHERAERRAGMIGELVSRTTVVKEESAPGVWVVTISHSGPDPEISFRVVSKLASGYQDNAYKGPVESQEKVVLQRQEDEEEARRAYERLSGELEAFEKDNAGFLDGPAERLGAVRDQIEEVEKVEIASIEMDLLNLDQMLEEEMPFNETEKEVRNEELIADIQRQIREVDALLTALRVAQGKRDAHPAVRAQLQVLEDLQRNLAEALADVRIEVEREPNPMHAELANEKRAAEGKLARARRQLTVLRNKETELLDDVRLAPEIQATSARMAREVTVARQTFEERQNRHTLAREQLQVVRSQRQLEFDTIDPPTRPKGPSGPSPLLIAFMGLAVGGAGGVGLAYLLDTMDHSFRETDQATAFLGLPTLGAIHTIRTSAEVSREQRRTRQYVGAILLVGLLACVLVTMAALGDGQSVASAMKAAIR